MKPSEKIKQEIETLLYELKELGYKVYKMDNTIDVYLGDKSCIWFELDNELSLSQLDKITENLLKLKVRV